MKKSLDEIENVYKLSQPQEKILFEILSCNDASLYSCQNIIEISGVINNHIIEKAWRNVVQEHSILRTMFCDTYNGKYVQMVSKENLSFFSKLKIKEDNLDDLKVIRKRKEEMEYVSNIRNIPFRVCLINAHNTSYIMITHNHILYDGWSGVLLLEAFLKRYDSLKSGKNYSLKVQQYHEVEYETFDFEKANVYWTQYIKPCKNNNVCTSSEKGARKIIKETYSIKNEDFKKTNSYFCNQGMTIAAGFFFLIGEILSMYYEDNIVVFDTVVSGRSSSTDDVIGLFINTLPIAFNYNHEKALALELQDFKIMYNEWISNQRISYADILKIIGKKGNKGLSNILVAIENYPINFTQRDSDIGLILKDSYEVNNYDITINIVGFNEIAIEIYYDKNKIAAGDIHKIINGINFLLNNINEFENKTILDIYGETVLFGDSKCEMEQLQFQIFQIWCEFLKGENISYKDNFFDVGGTSLNALYVQKQLIKKLECEISIVDIFDNPTIELLARHIYEKRNMKKNKDISDAISYFSNNSQEKIAVIGLAGYFPKANNKEKFWENLLAKAECISFFSDEELILNGEEKSKVVDKSYVKTGMILEDIDLFDYQFFGINKHEAELMDPQHRLFLQCAWEALEDGGYAGEEQDVVTGVYACSSFSSYLIHNICDNELSWKDIENVSAILGNDKDFMATRLNYALNLNGPGVMIQSGCSSSLVALHYACQDILNGVCEMALVGGMSVVVPQKKGYIYAEGGIRSKDGHCKAFDQNASGIVTGSGGGVILIKKLSDAIKDHDHIYSIIDGIGISNDGRKKVSYTAVSSEGEKKAIDIALKRANISPDQISYVEAHGSGTVLGDPIEFSALKEFYGKKIPCAIGLLKNNIGHLDVVSGIVGLIKVSIALEKGVIPANININNENESMDFSDTKLFVNKDNLLWNNVNDKRYAAVSSFGVGGTNAHVLLEEYISNYKKRNKKQSNIIVISAKTKESLEKYKSTLSEFLNTNKVDISNLAYTLSTGRKVFPFRFSAICNDIDELVESLTIEQKENCKNNWIYIINERFEDNYLWFKYLYNNEPLYSEMFSSLFANVIQITGASKKDIDINLLSEYDDSIKHFFLAVHHFCYMKYLKELEVDFSLYGAAEDIEELLLSNITDNRVMSYMCEQYKRFSEEKEINDTLTVNKLHYTTEAEIICSDYEENSLVINSIVEISEEKETEPLLVSHSSFETRLRAILLNMLTQQWNERGNINWKVYYYGKDVYKISIPTYRFAKERCWITRKNDIIDEENIVREHMKSIQRNEINDFVKKMWEKVFGIDDLKDNDNFFELGGNSLMVSQISLKYYQKYEIRVSVKDFMENPTISDQSTYLFYALGGERSNNPSDYLTY